MDYAWHSLGLVVESQGELPVRLFVSQLCLKYPDTTQILPWDSDIDVQVAEESMHFLASYYNMTVFHYKTPRIPEGRDYMLEINPHYINREQTDRLNVIDARWTDTSSGLFIDITTVRKNYTHPAGPGILSCKDKHEYKEEYIFPLRDSFFEGQPVKIPFAYAEVLSAEYGEKSLTEVNFQNHHFDEEKMEWQPVCVLPYPIQLQLKGAHWESLCYWYDANIVLHRY